MSCTALMTDPLGRWFNSNLGQPAPTSQVLLVSRLERLRQVALRIVCVAFVFDPDTALFSGYFVKAGQVFAASVRDKEINIAARQLGH
jgi:hypothetical protein